MSAEYPTPEELSAAAHFQPVIKYLSEIQETVIKETAWRGLRWKIIVIALVDVIFTLSVSLGNTAIIATKQCNNIREIASVQQQEVRTQEITIRANTAQTDQILKQPYLTLVVKGVGAPNRYVKMPVFGLPPAELKLLTTNGTSLQKAQLGVQQQELKALQSLAKSNCSTLL